MHKNSTLRYSFFATLPVMAGYLVLGIGFGVLLEAKGYGWWWAALMSLTIYAGSMQYVAIDLISGGASVATAAIMTVMVNIRHLFYGLTMVDRYHDAGRKKPYLIFALTDETFSLVCAPELPDGVDEKRYYFFVSLFDQCYWIAGSVIGGAAGAALSFNSAGIEFAMTALFVVIFLEQWEKAECHIPAVCGIAVSVICRLIFGASGFLIPAMAGILVSMLLARRFLQKEKEQKAAGYEKTGVQGGDT